MPVVKIELQRLEKLVNASIEKIIERIPYIGLDIEELTDKYIRVEYSPNRPDFGTEYGIASALRGILDIETGLPRYNVEKSEFKVIVSKELKEIRPFVSCVYATSLKLDNEALGQLLSLQEDLHQGIGRKRKKVAIGLHDASRISKTIFYKTVSKEYRFVPLGYDKEMSIDEILKKTDQGKEYGTLVNGNHFPVLEDSSGNTLSMPPIINGSITKLTESTEEIFVDVTGIDHNIGKKVLNIIASTLHEMGGKLYSVKINYGRKTELTPDMRPFRMTYSLRLVERITGLKITKKDAARYLARCRLSLKGNTVYVPCYRIDMLHPVDIAEEVCLGYGIDNLKPSYPRPESPGVLNSFENFLESVSNSLAMAGLLEVMCYELMDRKKLIEYFSRKSEQIVSVMHPKSLEHSLLRDSLIPSLMDVLAKNTKEEYPQRIFEVGRVFYINSGEIEESWHAGVALCHSHANYTEAKSYLQSLLSVLVSGKLETIHDEHWAFINGRSASIKINGRKIGYLGELKPEALYNFGISIPVAGFEINVQELWEVVKKD